MLVSRPTRPTCSRASAVTGAGSFRLRMPARHRRGRRDLPWPLAGDDVAVAHRIVACGEFQQPVEDKPAVPRAPPVEAEHELVQVTLQMRLLDRALVGAQKPPLGQRGDAVHCGQQLARVVAAGAGRALAAPLVDIAEPGQPVVAHPGAGDHPRARLDMAGHERVQRGRGRVGQDGHPAPADSPRLLYLRRDADQGFLAPGPPAAQPRLLAADVGLVHLHRPASRSRPGRTSTERSRCSIAHAVCSEPISSAFCRPSAEIPSLAVANDQHAANQTVSGVRVLSKIVPAVTEVRRPQAAHMMRPSPSRQPLLRPQSGQTNPNGHRTHSR